MVPIQKDLYREAMLKSKRILLENAGSLESQSPRTRGAIKSAVRPNENSSSNVLMDLRKAANHPMLFRRLYTDSKLRTIARDCLREIQFTGE